MFLCVLFGLEFAFKSGAVRWTEEEFALPFVSTQVERHPTERRTVPVKHLRAIHPTAGMPVAKQLESDAGGDWRH